MTLDPLVESEFEFILGTLTQCRSAEWERTYLKRPQLWGGGGKQAGGLLFWYLAELSGSKRLLVKLLNRYPGHP